MKSIAPEAEARIVPPAISAANNSAVETAREPGKLSAIVSPEKSVVAVPDMAARTAGIPSRAQDTNWIVSETTSPVDYSPLLTATIRSPSDAKDAPKALAIRCRGGRTELLVRTEGTWRASRGGEIQIGYQINEQAVVKLPWTASAEGNSASYKNDAVGLLQSLPEGGRLKINVIDGPDRRNEATFELAGWDAVREKIAAACKWAPRASRISSEQR